MRTILRRLGTILIIGRPLRIRDHAPIRTHRAHLLAMPLGLALVILLAACGSSVSDSIARTDRTPSALLHIVATTTILGDLVHNIVGHEATVEVLLPLGADPHDYQLSSQKVAALQTADLVIANGLGLEGALIDVLDTARADGANVLEVAHRLDPIPFGDRDRGDMDPHVWLDPIRMAQAARLIAIELAAIDGSVEWLARAAAYAIELLEAEDEIWQILSALPAQDRKLVTNHDALGYFAQRYGFEVIGTVVPGGATLADPSSAQLAALVATIEAHNVPAIFAETTEPRALAETIAREVGAAIEVVDLYTGSLGEPGSRADTLIGMLRTNAERITAALASGT